MQFGLKLSFLKGRKGHRSSPGYRLFWRGGNILKTTDGLSEKQASLGCKLKGPNCLPPTSGDAWQSDSVNDRVGEQDLVQIRVLGFGLLQDGDCRVGIFPQGEKIMIRPLCFRGVTGERIGAAELEVG